MKIAVLLTVYNRKETTITSLQSLFKAIDLLSIKSLFTIFMVDDGCTDGTSEAIQKLFPNIKIIKGSGNMYWSRGMRLAWKTALKTGTYDYYLWFNDDAILYPYALKELFDTLSKAPRKSIICGAFEDTKHKVSYGGRNLHHELITPNGTLQPIYYMNGNLVLISQQTVNEIGIIDSIFHHGFGDYDYGLRARKKGIIPTLTSQYVGVTDRHDLKKIPYFSIDYTLRKRLKILYSPKYSPIIEYKFNKRYYGIFMALRRFISKHVYTICPQFLKTN